MSLPSQAAERAIVAAQLGRLPREPWRVACRCTFGYPQVVVSPSRLDDGTPFPTYAWLTCPWLIREVSTLESSGAVSRYNERVRADETLSGELVHADERVRVARREESGGIDACETVGIAGQRDPLGIKCLHAHVALELSGVGDPIGSEVLGNTGTACPDRRCERLLDKVATEDR